jgi:hypothetical protein
MDDPVFARQKGEAGHIQYENGMLGSIIIPELRLDFLPTFFAGLLGELQ